MDNIATIAKLGELGILGLVLVSVLVGVWKLARPALGAWSEMVKSAVEAWLEQNQRLLDYLLKMTEALSLMNAQLEELHVDHKEITELLRNLNGKEK